MRWTVQFKLALVIAGLCCLQAGANPGTSAPYSEDDPPKLSRVHQEYLQRLASEQQELFKKRVIIPADAITPETNRSASAAPDAPPPVQLRPSAESLAKARPITILAAAFMLTGILGLRLLGPQITDFINGKFNPWALSPEAARRLASKSRSEEATFEVFLSTFRAGQAASAPPPEPAPVAGAPAGTPVETVEAVEAVEAPLPEEPLPVEELYAQAPRWLATMHQLLEEVRWAKTATPAQRALLEKLAFQAGTLKNRLNIPELLPAWQMASALEGLIKQLISKSSNVSPSTLRTAGISLDLLQELCVPGLPADLASQPPLRLLAVDDDPISRHALSWSLSKALTQPDPADNGEAALDLASRQAYDVIFLDVQMPGMDGFELCTRIHETELNRITPVVFVTGASDFSARAESALCGGADLISKPFLTFEITVVALTLALRHRLQASGHIAPATREEAAPALPSPRAEGTLRTDELDTDLWTEDTEILTRESAAASATQAALDNTIPTFDDEPVPLPPNDMAKAFVEQAPPHVRAYRDSAHLILLMEDSEVRRERLEELYLFVHSLGVNASLAGLQVAYQTCATLEGLIKKLIERPDLAAPSSLQTVAAAMDLLVDLSTAGPEADRCAYPPFRLLVVDDEPVARRALGGALQMVFGKPDIAESGKAALAFASRQAYDVIFMDVLMPNMDGFTLCSNIRETPLNQQAPVIFVTRHADQDLLDKSALCGGSDFVTKPFINTEITLKTLIFALRRRLHDQLEELQPEQGVMS